LSKNTPILPVEADHDASESPFAVPPVSSGYPLEDGEEKAIERVLEDGFRERKEEGGDQEAA